MNIVERIEGNNYEATDRDVEQLAQQITLGTRSGTTYLRIIVAAVQRTLGIGAKTKGKPLRAKKAQLDAIAAAHAIYYPAVLRGVGATAGKATAEHHRLATFARSSVSDLRGFVRAGGLAATIKIATVTKSGLRAARGPKTKGGPAGTVERSTAVIQRAAQRLARVDADQARTTLTAAISALQAELAKLEPAKIVRTRLQRTEVNGVHAH